MTMRDGQPPVVPPDTYLADLVIDGARGVRTGVPEAVYAAGKTAEQTARAVQRLLTETAGAVLATRADPEHAAAVRSAVPDATYDEVARVIVARPSSARINALVAVVAAGTSDLAVAREARTTLDALGLATDLVVDVGVAGPHRLVEARPRLASADVVVAVAGMEGALPTFLAALTDVPVVAVPTSIGHGAAFEGLAALLSMLTSCAPGVTVVNIDGGFSAAAAAARIARRLAAVRDGQVSA